MSGHLRAETSEEYNAFLEIFSGRRFYPEALTVCHDLVTQGECVLHYNDPRREPRSIFISPLAIIHWTLQKAGVPFEMVEDYQQNAVVIRKPLPPPPEVT